MTEDIHPAVCEKGLSIFHDIFRRADKNDDGFISWNEFTSFFADGIYSEEELKTLFNEIDTHNTNNIDTGELCSYFKVHLKSFQGVFGALEDLHGAIQTSLIETSESYDTKSSGDQFITRFIVREISRQMAAVNTLFENAGGALDEKAKEKRITSTPLLVAENDSSPNVITKRRQRRMKISQELNNESNNWGPYVPVPRNYSGSGASSYDDQVTRLQTQVDRLDKMIHKLQTQVKFSGLNDEKICEKEEELMYIVRNTVNIPSIKDQEFRVKLKQYVESLNSYDRCYHISVRSYEQDEVYIIYELWDSKKQRSRYMCSCDAARDFRCAAVKFCSEPEIIESLLLPSEWWTGS